MLTVNIDIVNRKYYVAYNSSLGVCGLQNELTKLSVMKFFCLPVLQPSYNMVPLRLNITILNDLRMPVGT